MRTLYTPTVFPELIWINLIDIYSGRIRIRINLLFLKVVGYSTSFENASISFGISQGALCWRQLLIVSLSKYVFIIDQLWWVTIATEVMIRSYRYAVVLT